MATPDCEEVTKYASIDRATMSVATSYGFVVLLVDDAMPVDLQYTSTYSFLEPRYQDDLIYLDQPVYNVYHKHNRVNKGYKNNLLSFKRPCHMDRRSMKRKNFIKQCKRKI